MSEDRVESSGQQGGSSIYALAERWVLISVLQRPDGQPEPLLTSVGEEPCMVAFTDETEAEADLPEGYKIYQIQVRDALLQLPPQAGLVVDPRAESPTYIPAGQKAEVVAAGKPFPRGARVIVGEPEEEPTELVEALKSRPPQGTQRLWRVWYQAEDAPPKLLLAYESETGQDASVADGIYAVVAALRWSDPVLVLAMSDLPDGHQRWLLDNISPFLDLRGGRSRKALFGRRG